MRLSYREKSFTFTLNQVLSKEWAVGAAYRISEAELGDRLTELPATVVAGADRNLEAILQQLNLYVLYNHRCGFFSQVDSVWSSQSNRGYSPDIPGDDFWQFNAYVGYRFFRRAAEARIGLLNLTDRDYRLNPLNLYSELPRERIFTASLRFYF